MPWCFLEPIAKVYGSLFELKKRFAKPQKVDKPVICIGNLTLGGNGKTPLVSMVAGHMQAFGLNPHILVRGFGGRIKAPTLITDQHTVHDVGDEALLLAQCAPTWIGANRYKSAQLAIQAGADVLLMDDGFQNFSLQKDLSLVLVDATTGLGNGHLFPAGPLREPWMSGLARADALFIIDNNDTITPLVDYALKQGKPVFFAQRFLRIPDNLRERSCVAFSGLGGPSTRFVDTLEREGLKNNICASYAFPDHHRFSNKQAQMLLDVAKGYDAALITTHKDAMRLRACPKGTPCRTLYEAAHPITMGLEMDSWDEFEIFITQSFAAV